MIAWQLVGVGGMKCVMKPLIASCPIVDYDLLALECLRAPLCSELMLP